MFVIVKLQNMLPP